MVELVRAVRFGYEPTEETVRLLHDFRDMLNFCLDRAFETNSFTIKRLHHACYGELKARYDYNSQYFVSAIKTAVSMISSWKKRGGGKPKARKLFIEFSPLLTHFEGDKLRISVKPRKFLTIPLKFGDYQRRFIELWRQRKLRIGEIIMNKHWVIVPFKQEIDLTKPDETIAIDINETNVTAVDPNGNRLKIDTSKIRAIHEAYSHKLRRVQQIGDSKVKKRLLAKYSGRRKHRIYNLLHKHKLNGFDVVYLNPHRTSSECFRCGGIKHQEKTCPKRGLDRDVNTCLNLLKMWGVQGSPKASLIKVKP